MMRRGPHSVQCVSEIYFHENIKVQDSVGSCEGVPTFSINGTANPTKSIKLTKPMKAMKSVVDTDDLYLCI